MPFSAAGVYSRFKTFANGGSLLPSDLNSIQDELGVAIQNGWKTGDIKMSALAGDNGWIPCDGTALTVGMGYTNLRNRLITDGMLYGDDGSGNPRVPDMRGRSPVAPDGGAGRLTTNNALGQSGGASLHQHSSVSPVSVRNTHMKVVDPSLSASYFADATDGKTGRGISGNTGTVTPSSDFDPDAISGMNVYLYNTGQLTARYLIASSNESTFQPYQCVSFFIKI